ncbi:MAG: hypothetical protein ACYCW6_09310, partial [Candidatus Xenobia bacterium]
GAPWGDQPVTASEPQLDNNGQPVMHDVHNLEFSGHGTPGPVQWVHTPIQVTTLDHGDPYSFWAQPQTHMVEVYTGTDSHGNPQYTWESQPNGLYNNYFSPNENERTVGTYEKPQVHFNSGINTGGILVTDLAIGAGAGAALGAIAGALIAHNKASQG